MNVAVDVFVQVEENLETKPYRKIREVIADAYTFIRAVKANEAFSNVTLEELMGDQIKRNGESARSNAAQYTPYSYDPQKGLPAGLEPSQRANFLGAADTGNPTKYDRVLAIKNSLSAVISQAKSLSPIEVAGTEDYTDAGTIAAPTEPEG